jgi:hypothetical protein
LADWEFIRDRLTPGIKLDLRYNNTGLSGINVGNLGFSVYSVYRQNETLSEPVNLLGISLPKFSYRPGSHNFTIENRFQLKNVNSVKATTQLLSNYLFNETSIIVLRDFHAWYNHGTPLILVT